MREVFGGGTSFKERCIEWYPFVHGQIVSRISSKEELPDVRASSFYVLVSLLGILLPSSTITPLLLSAFSSLFISLPRTSFLSLCQMDP